MTEELVSKYNQFYDNQSKKTGLWPTEFAVRALLGETYSFNINSGFDNALDLGFGDGRNFNLLKALFSNVAGLEISDEICRMAANNFPDIEYIVGRSNQIYKPDNFYDLVLAVHSIYYCSKYEINSHFAEVSRVLKPNGRLIFSFPTNRSYLVKNAVILDDDYALITSDPLNIRNGTIIKFYRDKKSLIRLLKEQGFKNIMIGKSLNDWWGIKEYCWIVSCNKS